MKTETVIVAETIRNLKAYLLIICCALGLVAHGATKVTTVDELLAAAAKASSGETIQIASPNGIYPVTLMMTNSITINSDGKKYSITLCGATGNPDDVILDFSSKPMRGIWMKGQYWNTSMVKDLTVQNATNTVANDRIGGGISTQDCTVKNCVVRNCVASKYGGGILYHCKDAMQDCIVSNCAATAQGYAAGGGGIWIRSGSVSGTFVTNCYCKGASGTFGGGIGTLSGGLSNCRVVDCHNKSGSGGGVYAKPAITINNCLLSGNSATVVGGGFYAGYTSSSCTAKDSTFIDNSCGGSTGNVTGGGALAVEYVNVKNCLFMRNQCSTGSGMNGGAVNIMNGGTLVSCVFRENSGGRAGAAWGSFNKISNCVFETNSSVSTADGGGPIWLGNSQNGVNSTANMVIEDCIFRENTSVNCSNGGGVIGCDWGNNAQTNMVIRNCYFKDNDTAAGTFLVRRLHCESYSPTFENGYGLNVVNCTFDSNVTSSKCILNISEGSYLAGPSVFFRNCHFTGTSGYSLAATGTYGYISLRPDHVQYCVADKDITNLPTAEAYHNYYGKRTRNKGQNQAWMDGAQDLGDGTYTLGKSADWGVTVTINNRKHRVCNQTVDAGCFEVRHNGLVVIIR